MNEKKIDLRKNVKPVATPERPKFQSRAVNGPGFKGKLPFAPGAVIDENMVRGADDRIDSILGADDTRGKNSTAVKSPPQAVKLEDLPEGKQQEILSAIAGYDKTPIKPIKQENVKTDASDNKTKEEDIITASVPDLSGVVCRHCGWPVEDHSGTDPTSADKQVFVASILGQKRFVKTYSLMGGAYTLVFRSLTTSESDLVIKQLVKDWNDGKISGQAQSFAEAVRYQMYLGLEAVQTAQGIINLPGLDQYTFDTPEKDATVLPDFISHLQDTVLVNEPLRRIANKAFGHFVHTLSKLEAMAETADFWSASEA